MYPPAIFVHRLAQARLALAPGRPVTLLSGPGAGLYAGVGWWLALMQAARANAPAPDFPHMLDCADSPGRALEAVRAGQKILILSCPEPTHAQLIARAATLGATLLPAAPPALDLATPSAERRLHAWLQSG